MADGLHTPIIHAEPPWASRFPPYLRYFSIPGDFRFVLLWTHRAPGSLLSRLLCSFGRHLQLHLGTLRLGPLQFGTLPISASCIRFRSLSERPRGSQLPKSPPQQPAVARFLRGPHLVLLARETPQTTNCFRPPCWLLSTPLSLSLLAFVLHCECDSV
jgi:hypothetical protein